MTNSDGEYYTQLIASKILENFSLVVLVPKVMPNQHWLMTQEMKDDCILSQATMESIIQDNKRCGFKVTDDDDYYAEALKEWRAGLDKEDNWEADTEEIKLVPIEEKKHKCTCPKENFYFNGIGCKCNGS